MKICKLLFCQFKCLFIFLFAVLVKPKDDDNAEEDELVEEEHEQKPKRALDETHVLCTRCKMMVNQNHKKLCSEFFNLVIKNARGETKCYFCEMKFKFRNKAYQHIKLNHFSKKVVISCKKLSNETIDEYNNLSNETTNEDLDDSEYMTPANELNLNPEHFFDPRRDLSKEKQKENENKLKIWAWTLESTVRNDSICYGIVFGI